MKKLRIEIWSDIACPYCYIGKRKLEKALDSFPHKDEVQLEWHSYELNPDLPKEAPGKPAVQLFAEKQGISMQKAEENFAAICRLACTSELYYHPEKQIVTNTRDALRLVKLAAEQGLASEAEEVLFNAYFVKGLNVSDPAILVRLGTQIGLKEQSITDMLGSDKYIEDVKKDTAYGDEELGLEYIPFYKFNNKQVIQGSVAVEDYQKVLTEAYNEWKSGISSGNNEIVSGQSCSIDGVCN